MQQNGIPDRPVKPPAEKVAYTCPDCSNDMSPDEIVYEAIEFPGHYICRSCLDQEFASMTKGKLYKQLAVSWMYAKYAGMYDDDDDPI